eukprot:Unigene13715_Nuclearia_a/m.41457 Unigene13715_Nuclearia_a/g.41457  ORF Unigene13715_Nuclearia_a/g.41457 Unigene13715_Nuclearia_a/m.41457 type:complete len:353 (+) Unigene13715_Nuclearia_a:1351-2409(+)
MRRTASSCAKAGLRSSEAIGSACMLNSITSAACTAENVLSSKYRTITSPSRGRVIVWSISFSGTVSAGHQNGSDGSSGLTKTGTRSVAIRVLSGTVRTGDAIVTVRDDGDAAPRDLLGGAAAAAEAVAECLEGATSSWVVSSLTPTDERGLRLGQRSPNRFRCTAHERHMGSLSRRAPARCCCSTASRAMAGISQLYWSSTMPQSTQCGWSSTTDLAGIRRAVSSAFSSVARRARLRVSIAGAGPSAVGVPGRVPISGVGADSSGGLECSPASLLTGESAAAASTSIASLAAEPAAASAASAAPAAPAAPASDTSVLTSASTPRDSGARGANAPCPSRSHVSHSHSSLFGPK